MFPKLQIGGQLVTFMIERLSRPIPSPALLGKITQGFVAAVKQFADHNGIPVLKFEHKQRKDDIAKEKRTKRAVRFETLDNGFRNCDDPRKLQEICDSLGPGQIDPFFRKWLPRIPLPMTAEDRVSGYDWELSMWQVEVSLTQVFDHPLRGRQFFEEVLRDNLDPGRSERIALVFDRKTPRKRLGDFETRVICTFTCMTGHTRMWAEVLLRYGRRKALSSLRLGDPQPYGLGQVNADRYEAQERSVPRGAS